MRIFSITPPEGTKHKPAMIVKCSGCTRTVFLIGKWAIKLPVMNAVTRRDDSLLRGMLANIQEASCWAIKETREMLAPVIYCAPFGLFLIMRRCEPLAGELPEREAKRFYYDSVRETGYMVPVEDKPSSFGYLNGRIVAVDYGS